MVVYLDANATTPIDPDVVGVMTESLREDWINPSSSYSSADPIKNKISEARVSMLMALKADPEDSLVFVSGGTEANHVALHHASEAFRVATRSTSDETPHIITSNLEHVALELPAKRWHQDGSIDLTIVKADPGTAAVKVDDVVKSIKSNTCLISIIFANNETGVIQPIEQLGQAISQINFERMMLGLPPILFHTDAAQVFGKIPVNLDRLNVDLMTIVGHKFYGPRSGALYVRSKPMAFYPLFLGGNQEMGMRAGTENVPMILGLSQALSLAQARVKADAIQLGTCRSSLLQGLKDRLGDRVRDNFAHIESEQKLPNTLSVAFKDVQGSQLLRACRDRLCASTGAACHSSQGSVSSASDILRNSGLDPDQSAGTVRLSVGRHTTMDQVQEAIQSND